MKTFEKLTVFMIMFCLLPFLLLVTIHVTEVLLGALHQDAIWRVADN
jgi:hypothetical protein